MIRLLYRLLLSLHPPAFRREFAGEMLWIFDESAGYAARVPLFFDALASLARQWLLRSGAWKLLAACAGGLAQITVGGFGFVLFHRIHGAAHAIPEPGSESADMARLVYMVAWVTAGLLCSVMALVVRARRRLLSEPRP